jgi:hypothetical protein
MVRVARLGQVSQQDDALPTLTDTALLRAKGLIAVGVVGCLFAPIAIKFALADPDWWSRVLASYHFLHKEYWNLRRRCLGFLLRKRQWWGTLRPSQGYPFELWLPPLQSYASSLRLFPVHVLCIGWKMTFPSFLSTHSS